MHQSYEALDRPGGFSRVRLLAPLAHRDYRLLLAGLSVSLLGDGVFMVALAWQVYSLSDVPTALASVGIAISIPTVACLLWGGAVSDRFDRRRVMLVADCVRGACMAAVAVLSATGELRLWHLFACGALYGAGTAFFDPASDALVPELLPADLLAQANSLDQLLRPLMLRLAGPALGGTVVGALGSGGAFGFDACSFAVSVVALVAISERHATPAPATVPPPEEAGSAQAVRPLRLKPRPVHAEIADGFRYVRRHAWLWATLVSAAFAYLLFMGPIEVLLPFIVRNRLHGGAFGLGLVFAAGGVGSLLCAVAIGQGGLPRRKVAFMYSCWTVATLAVAGYGLSKDLWGLMLASVAFNTLETAGTIAWATVKQSHVPRRLLGRVSSLDWLVSIGLLPASFALTGPVSAALGLRATLVGAGLLGAAITLAAMFVPGVRALDEQPDPSEPGPQPAVGLRAAPASGSA